MTRRSMLSPAELGMAVAAFNKVTVDDPFWESADYERVVRFWCSDLICQRVDRVFAKAFYFEVVTPNSGRRVSFAETASNAWLVAAAVVHDHLVKERKKRNESRS